jgi:hypothetical protein
MTIFMAVIYQVALFCIGILFFTGKAYVNGREDWRDEMPPDFREPLIIIPLLFLWFVVLTHYRAVQDWPLAGIWYYLIKNLLTLLRII